MRGKIGFRVQGSGFGVQGSGSGFGVLVLVLVLVLRIAPASGEQPPSREAAARAPIDAGTRRQPRA